jgi:hypothetical protein
MAQIIEIPGVGEVEFPDEMDDAAILAAVQKLSAPKGPALQASHAPTQPYAPLQVSRAESGARGGLQGLSAGWGDEGAAAIAALLPFTDREAAKGDTFGERYENAKGFYRGRNAQAEQANPGTYLTGQIAGAVAPTLLGSPASGVKAIAQAAGQGAAQGAGYSEREGFGLASDTAFGAGLGLLGHGTGKVVGKVGSAAVGKGRDLVRAGTARAGVQASKEVAEEVASAAGKYGAEVQKGSRQVENLMRLDPAMTPQQRALYQGLQQQGIVPTLQQSVAQSTLDALPSQAGTIATRQAELAALQQNAPQAVASRAKQLLTPQVKADAKSFLKAYAEPAAWAFGAQQLGSAAGLDPGQQGALAAAAGIVGGRTRAGKALYTRLTRPAHQVALGRGMRSTGRKVEATARGLQRSFGPALPAILMSTPEPEDGLEPETRALVLALRGG